MIATAVSALHVSLLTTISFGRFLNRCISVLISLLAIFLFFERFSSEANVIFSMETWDAFIITRQQFLESFLFPIKSVHRIGLRCHHTYCSPAAVENGSFSASGEYLDCKCTSLKCPATKKKSTGMLSVLMQQFKEFEEREHSRWCIIFVRNHTRDDDWLGALERRIHANHSLRIHV